MLKTHEENHQVKKSHLKSAMNQRTFQKTVETTSDIRNSEKPGKVQKLRGGRNSGKGSPCWGMK